MSQFREEKDMPVPEIDSPYCEDGKCGECFGCWFDRVIDQREPFPSPDVKEPMRCPF